MISYQTIGKSSSNSNLYTYALSSQQLSKSLSILQLNLFYQQSSAQTITSYSYTLRYLRAPSSYLKYPNH